MISKNKPAENNYLSQFKGFLTTADIREGLDHEIPVFQFPKVEINENILSELASLNNPRNSVLGKRMESFFEIAIRNSERYDLIASNIQIVDHKTTIGELDFLLFDNELQKHLHVELVYKIYVYDHAATLEEDKWIGPNRRDSFSEKMQKLKSKQLPLLYQQATKKYLENNNLAVIDFEQQLCYKAQVYKRDFEEPNPNTVNLETICGKWYTYDEFTKTTSKNAEYYAPKKNEWSCLPAENKNWISYPEILLQIEALFEKGKSPLIWMKTGDSYKRFFIVWW